MTLDFWTVIYFILIFGSFGGVVSYFSFCVYGGDGGFREKFHVELKSAWAFALINGIVGVAGAFAVQVLLLGMRFYEKTIEPGVSDFLFLAAICLIGGFAARTFLNQVSQMFARQIKQEIDQLAERTASNDERHARQILLLTASNDRAPPETLEFALADANEALKKDPNDALAIIAKGCALKRLNRIQEAIDTLNPYLDAHKSASKADKYISTAYFNRACYLALLGRPENALQDLRRSLDLSETPVDDKKLAAAEKDFVSLYENEAFKNLVK